MTIRFHSFFSLFVFSLFVDAIRPLGPIRGRVLTFILPLLFLCVSPAGAHGHDIAKEIFDAAEVLIGGLDEAQVKTMSFSFDDELRKDWQFIPMKREGLGISELRPHQRLLALSLIQTALSHRGFSQSLQIMALEQILHDLEKQNPVRDSQKYHLFVFGTPSCTETWGWRIEGHHLSVSFTLVGGKTVVATPAFFGANPGEVRDGRQAGLRVLANEEDLGRRLIKNLSVEQKRTAILNQPAPNDVINGPGRKASPLEPAGIAASEMTADQQEMLRELIDCYVNRLRAELAQADWKRIEDAGFEKIHFAWAGELLPGKPHYYRVQGPTFIMEYDNTQNGANHPHTVWRDFKNDFGADLLRQHYDAVPHANER